MVALLLLASVGFFVVGLLMGRALGIANASNKALRARVTALPTGPICQCGHARSYHVFAGTGGCHHVTPHGFGKEWTCDCQTFVDRDADIKELP